MITAEDLKTTIAGLSRMQPRPTAVIVHPGAYVAIRRMIPTLAIEDDIGGRRWHDHNRKRPRHRSRVLYRKRKAAALAHVFELWSQERRGPQEPS